MKRISFGILIALFIGVWSYEISLKLVPKGTVMHEILRMPAFGFRLITAPQSGVVKEKYFYGEHRRQHLIFYLPKDKVVTQENIIYYVHGGAWIVGFPGGYKAMAKLFTDQGYAVIMPAYRLLPKHNTLDMQTDIVNGFKKAKEILKEKKLGDKKIIIGGESAGANLTGLLLYNRNNLRAATATHEDFAGYLSISGPLNFEKMPKSKIMNWYAGTPDSTTFYNASPYHFLRKTENIPVLCIHGTSDGFVPYANSKSFVEHINQLSPNIARFLTIEGGTHIEVAGQWMHQDNEVRKMILNWIEGL